MATDYGVQTPTPAIPDPDHAEMKTILRAIKEWIEVREGDRGAGLDRAVTVRDLLNGSVITPEDVAGMIGQPLPTPPGSTSDASVPPTPTHLAAAGALTQVILTWRFPTDYKRLSYFEIWRSATNVVGEAVKIGQTTAQLYADPVNPDEKFFYWVRAVSDVATSPFNAILGVMGQTAINVEQVREVIADDINDTGLLEQLSLKEDEDGFLYGYGLANTPSQAGAGTKTFAILASRFLIAGPASSGVIPSPAFVVQTQDTVINGVTAPKGAYLDAAFIQNGVITNAKIGTAAIDTAKVASLSAEKITFGEMNGDRIQANTLNANRIITSTLTAKLASVTDAYINNANIVNGAITNAKLANASITAAKIQDGQITNAKIQNGSIDSAKISTAIQSDNFVPNWSGWQLHKNGTFQMNGPGGSGRLVITNSLLQVFDGNGTLRVRLGLW